MRIRRRFIWQLGGWITASIVAFAILFAIGIKLDIDAYRALASVSQAAAREIRRSGEESPRPHKERQSATPPEPARQQNCGTSQWQSLIEQAASRFALPGEYIHAVMRAESTGCIAMNGKPTVSSAGAMGLMQLMPSVWREQRKRLQLGDDPHDPRDNILAGAAYLRELVDRFGWPGASAAYHAGPARYDEYLASSRPLPAATLEYMARIERSLHHDKLPFAKPPNRSVFATRTAAESSDIQSPVASSDVSIFVRIRRREPQANGEAPESKYVQQP